MILTNSKTKVVSFSRKTEILIYDYRLRQSSKTRADSMKDPEIFLGSELHFHNHDNHIFSHCIKLPGLVRRTTFTFSSLECMHGLITLVTRSKLEYASVAWNSMASTDCNKLVRIQQRFSTLSLNRFFPQVHYCNSLDLEELKLHTLRIRRHRLDTLFLTQVYIGSKFCPCVL
jgi:hypothetical protein